MKRHCFDDFPHVALYGGSQWILQFGDEYQLSIVRHRYSIGANNGLYEIGLFGDTDTMAHLPGITLDQDTVQGNLTADEVNVIILKLQTITGEDPVNALPPRGAAWQQEQELQSNY